MHFCQDSRQKCIYSALDRSLQPTFPPVHRARFSCRHLFGGPSSGALRRHCMVRAGVDMADQRSTGQKMAAAARRSRAWDYALRGWTNQRIAEQLAQDGLGRVSRQAVHKMLDKMRRELFAEL